MFTPEEWEQAWLGRARAPENDALGDLIRERLLPYAEILLPIVRKGWVSESTFVDAMVTLALIEEIEAAREMRKLSL